VGVVGIQGAYRTPQSEKHAMLLISLLQQPRLSQASPFGPTSQAHSGTTAWQAQQGEAGQNAVLSAPHALFLALQPNRRNRREASPHHQAASSHPSPSLPPPLAPHHRPSYLQQHTGSRRASQDTACQERAKGQTTHIDRAAPDAAF